MEAKYSISFPPLLRYYIENISRETSFTFYRSLVQPRDYDLWYRVNEMTLDEHYEAKGKQRALEPPTWSCHVAQHGCGYDETIWFSGRLRGFVQFAQDMCYPYIRTLYERMIESDPSDGSIESDDDVIFPTLEETLLMCRDVEFSETFRDGQFGPELNEIKDIELPDELKVCRRGTVEAIKIILGHARIRRMVEDRIAS